jgi:hypothetical protein
MNGVVSVKCEDCKFNYVPKGQKFCRECVEKQIKEEE